MTAQNLKSLHHCEKLIVSYFPTYVYTAQSPIKANPRQYKHTHGYSRFIALVIK